MYPMKLYLANLPGREEVFSKLFLIPNCSVYRDIYKLLEKSLSHLRRSSGYEEVEW
jgi:hypothetical protein